MITKTTNKMVACAAADDDDDDGVKHIASHSKYKSPNLTAMEALYHFATDLHNDYIDEFPIICHLTEIAITVPMASVACEQTFSTQNRIKSKYRNSMHLKALDTLIRISTSLIPIHEFPFERAIAKWESGKARGSGPRQDLDFKFLR